MFIVHEIAEEVFEAADAFLDRPPRDLESSGVRQKNSSSEDSFLFLFWSNPPPEAAEDFLEIDTSPWEELEPSKRRIEEKKKIHSMGLWLLLLLLSVWIIQWPYSIHCIRVSSVL